MTSSRESLDSAEAEPFEREESPARRFREEVKRITKIKGASIKFKKGSRKPKFVEKRRELIQKYANCNCVKDKPDYVDLWLSLADDVAEPEEVYMYMNSEQIGTRSLDFYQAWVGHYIQSHEFILANQVFELAESRLKSERLGPRLGNFNHELAVLRKWIESEFLAKLVEHFYSKEFYQCNVNHEANEDNSSNFDDEGISEEDFNDLRTKNLKARTNSVLARVYGSDLVEDDDAGKKKIARPAVASHTRKKKFSELINVKHFDGISIYIDKEFRHSIPKIRTLAYEYEYMMKRYKVQKVVRKNSKEPFFVTEENQKKKCGQFLRKESQNFQKARPRIKKLNCAKTKFPDQSDENSRVNKETKLNEKTKPEKRQSSIDSCVLRIPNTKNPMNALFKEVDLDTFIRSRIAGIFDAKNPRVQLIKPKLVEQPKKSLLKELPRTRQSSEDES